MFQTDNGGPFICNNTLAGIINIPACATFGTPSVYTDVFAYSDWIKENSKISNSSSSSTTNLLTLTISIFMLFLKYKL